jgi:hypothetical protein
MLQRRGYPGNPNRQGPAAFRASIIDNLFTHMNILCSDLHFIGRRRRVFNIFHFRALKPHGGERPVLGRVEAAEIQKKAFPRERFAFITVLPSSSGGTLPIHPTNRPCSSGQEHRDDY